MAVDPMGGTPPRVVVAPPSWIDQFWPHLTAVAGAFVAIGLGAADHFIEVKDAWGIGVDLSLIWAGLGALGVTAVAAYNKNPA